MIDVRLLNTRLDPIAEELTHSAEGAELIFQGRVRETEHGRKIVGLEYEYYAAMAEQELRRLADKTIERFGVRDVTCWHRVGLVPVGEVAVRVTIWSVHREESLAAMAWFISEMKRVVPIWKWAVEADGTRYPSHCSHQHVRMG